MLENEIWKIGEVLSYDHQSLAVEDIKSDIEKLLIENNVPALGIGIIDSGKLTKVEVTSAQTCRRADVQYPRPGGYSTVRDYIN